MKGKSILHLQCHFGQDSISLARFGANITGVDLSDEAIKLTNELAEKAIVSLDEFDYSPCNCFKMTIEVEPKKYRIEHLGNYIPMTYSIKAEKKEN